MNVAVPTFSTRVETADLQLRIDCIRREANDIVSLELNAPSGEMLPEWAPGANIRLHLPSGVVRQYSLCGEWRQGAPYRIAVHRAKNSKGGSSEVHERLRVGTILKGAGPFNNFDLVRAERYLFIAGGIGITPILPMIGAVDGRAEWQLVYCGRSRADMAFVSQIEQFSEGRTKIIDRQKGPRPDLRHLIDTCAPGTCVYACGPAAMLDQLMAICAERNQVELHIEHFGAPFPASSITRADDNNFDVILARSGITLTVPPGSTILEEVKKVIPSVAFSCEAGFCGTCETRVISGEVDHRDTLLTAEERAKNKTMMICVSRSIGGQIVLDL